MRRLTVAILVMLVLRAGASAGMSVSTPLAELNGPVEYDPLNPTRITFDFGTEFQQIDAVWIEIDARVEAQQFDLCTDPASCVHHTILVGFLAIIDEEDQPFPGSIFSDRLDFSDDPRAAIGSGLAIAQFNNASTWNILLDGEGTLELSWNSPAIVGGQSVQNFLPPSGEISAARLIAHGTPVVPEPTVALLLGSGLAALAAVKPAGG